MSTIKAWMMAHRVIAAIVVFSSIVIVVAGLMAAIPGNDPSDGVTRRASATTFVVSVPTTAPLTEGPETTAEGDADSTTTDPDPSSTIADTIDTTPSTVSMPATPTPATPTITTNPVPTRPPSTTPSTTAPRNPPATPRPTLPPTGVFGETAGEGRDIAPGVSAIWWSAPNDSRAGTRVGRIELDAPGDLVLTGEYRYVSAREWRIVIDGASGRLAGVAPGVADGEIRLSGTRISSAVDVALPGHPAIVPSWSQTASIHIGHDAARGLVGFVGVVTDRAPSSIGLLGIVAPDGSYTLGVAGIVHVAGVAIPVDGSYGAATGRGPVWSIGGSTPLVRDGATVLEEVTIEMDDRTPGVTGRAAVVLAGMTSDEAGGGHRVPTTLDLLDTDDWTLTAAGLGDADATSTVVPGLRVGTGRLTGHIRSTAGDIGWSLRGPVNLVDGNLTMGGDVAFTEPTRFTVGVTGGNGSILGDATSRLDHVAGTIVVDGTDVRGRVSVTGATALGIALPAGWTTSTDMRLWYATESSRVTTTVDLDQTLVSGESRLTLEGRFPSGAPFELDAAGHATKHESDVPFDGYYRSAGFVVDGVALSAPDYHLVGDIGSANGGTGVPIPGDATLVDGELRLSSRDLAAPVAATVTPWGRLVRVAAVTPAVGPAAVDPAPTMSGTATLQLASNSSFTIEVTVEYTDEDDWTETVSSTGTATFSPAGLSTLTISASDITGTITDTAGVIDWNLVVQDVTWTIVSDVTVTGSLEISETCPLTNTANCPGSDPAAVFIGLTDASIASSSLGFTVPMEGAVLTDGSWARFDATPPDLTFHGIGFSGMTLSLWTGAQSTSPTPDIGMPDVSDLSNGLGVAFCGSFEVPVPGITMPTLGGCAQLTEQGVIVAQNANPPDTATTPGTANWTDSDGVGVGGSSTIDGYAWTDIASSLLGADPQVTFENAAGTLASLALQPDLDQFVGTTKVPQRLANAIGVSNTDVPATGWYSDGDFLLSATLPVDVTSGGFTLDSLSLDIGKDGDTFSLSLVADATAKIGGNHFPVTASLSVNVGGGTNDLVVDLTAKGAVSADPTGGFDQPTLLPTGTFEPENSDLVDGSFDGKQTGSLVPDGSFENAADGGNLLSNAEFENGIAPDLLPNGGFEDGSTTNLLANGDAEQTDVAYNGDFELGSTSGWSTSAGMTATMVSGDSSPANPGDYAVSLKNVSFTSTNPGGLSQTVAYQPIDGGTYTVSVWAKSTTSSTFVLYSSMQGLGAGCTAPPSLNTDASQSFTTTSSWQQYTMTVTGSGCHGQWEVFMYPQAVNSTVTFDDLELTTVSTPAGAASVTVPNQMAPQGTQTFEGDAGLTTYLTDGSLTYDSTFGNQGRSYVSTSGAAFDFPTNGWGYTSRAFDVSYDVYFNASGSRALSHFGFWLTGSGGSQSGFGFRMQSATGNNADSGFWTISGSNTSGKVGPGFGAVQRQRWYRVRLYTTLAADGTTVDVNAQVYDLSTGLLFWDAYGIALPAGNRSGVFGAVLGGGNPGHRYDNVRVTSGATGLPRVVRDGTAHGGEQYISATPGAGSWDMITSTLEVPDADIGIGPGAVYTYSAWIRSKGGNASAQIGLDTVGQDYESHFEPITITGTWQRFSVSLTIEESGHTDLRPILRLPTMNGLIEIDIDDQLLQKVNGWWSYPLTCSAQNANVERAMWVDQDVNAAHSGSGFMTAVDYSGCGQGFYTTVDAVPQPGGTYTVSGWFRSDQPVEVQINLEAMGGAYEGSNRAWFATTSTWTQYSFPLTFQYAGNTQIRVTMAIVAGYGGKPLQFDDLTLVPTDVTIPQLAQDQWGTATYPFDTMPTGAPVSSQTSVTIVDDYANPGNSLRTDGEQYWFFDGSYGAANGDFDISTDLYFPDPTTREIANIGFWITNPGAAATGYMFRVQTINGDSGFFTVDDGTIVRYGGITGPVAANTWYRVRLTAVGSRVTGTVTRLTDSVVIATATLTMPDGNRSGVFGQVRDGAASPQGHRWDNFTIHQGDTAPVWADQPDAYSGTGFLRVDASTGTGTTSRTVATNVVAGETYTASAWVRSTTGTTSGTLSVSAGSVSSSNSFVADTTWRPVAIDLPITSSAAAITVSLQDATGGGALDVDDVSLSLLGLTQVQPWIASSPSGGLVTSTVLASDGPLQAHTGDNYRIVQVAAAGDGITMPITSTSNPSTVLSPGSVWTASAWVRAVSGTVSGTMSLAATGGTAESRSMPGSGFTATTTWQQVFVTLPVSNAGHTGATVAMQLTTTGQRLMIDDVALLPLESWTLDQPAGVAVHALVVDDLPATPPPPPPALSTGTSSDAPAAGPGYLQVISTGANGGVSATADTPVVLQDSFVMEGYVRSRTGAPLTGRFVLTASADAEDGEVVSQPFTAKDGQWTYVVLPFPPSMSATQLRADVLLDTAGTLDIDQISIRPNIIAQSDPWTADAGVNAVVRDRPNLAHDSNGLMTMSVATPGTGIQHEVTSNPSQGAEYDVTAWLRPSAAAATVTGTVQLIASGGSAPTQIVSQPFSVTGADWQFVTFRMTVADAGRTMLSIAVQSGTRRATLYVDDVIVQEAGPWTVGGSATMAQTGDAAGAQSGSGYLTISKNSSADAWVQRTTSGTVDAGSVQEVDVWVRSTTDTPVAGRVSLSALGSGAGDTITSSFTATSVWQLVPTKLTVGTTAQQELLVQIFNDTQGTALAIDTVIVGESPIDENPDGVLTPLPHPESGYVYLWDEAFGIPGAHLWSLTAQLEFAASGPSLGVGGTMYFDPSTMPKVLVGTDWLKADMAVNISRTDPCLSFGFDATNYDVAVEIQGGVFETKKFQISFAPRGCQVGEYTVPQGASFGFQTELGDATFFVDMAVTKGPDGPEYHSAMGLSNLVWGGFTYNEMELTIDITPTTSATSFVGDFELPMGKFYGSFDLTASGDGITSTGEVSVTDWQMANGAFDVSNFSYTQTLDIPTGGCGRMSTTAATLGDMSLGSKHYSFNGDLQMYCGDLQVLSYDFQYTHGGLFFDYHIDYDGATRLLTGGLEFDFDRKISWRFLGAKHTRHPKFDIALDFRMPIDDPAEGELTLTGDVSVAGGSGSVDCTMTGDGTDDSCNLSVTITVLGTVHYNSTW